MKKTTFLSLLVVLGTVFFFAGAALVVFGVKYLFHPAHHGAVSMLLEVQAEDALRVETDKDLDTFLRELREESGVAEAGGTRTDDNSFELTGVPAARDGEVRDKAARLLPLWSWNRTGEVLRFQRRIEVVADIREQAIRQTVQTIGKRMDAFVTEPVLQRQGLGSSRIVVRLPGVDDPERVKNLIGNSGFLEFRFVDYPPQGPALSEDEILANYGGVLPDGIEIFPQHQLDIDGNVVGQNFLALERRRIITGRDLRTARFGLSQFNEPIVNFYLTQDGASRFGEATAADIGRQLAIVLDGKVQSAPVVQGRIYDQGQIEGQFTQQQVEDLVSVLRSGALAAPVVVIGSEPISGAQWLRVARIRAGVCLALLVLSGASILALILRRLKLGRRGGAPEVEPGK